MYLDPPPPILARIHPNGPQRMLTWVEGGIMCTYKSKPRNWPVKRNILANGSIIHRYIAVRKCSYTFTGIFQHFLCFT